MILYPYEDKIGFVNLVDKFTTDVGLKVVNTARISYNKQKEVFDDKDKKLVNFLWNEDHTSPFRHSFYTFHIKMPLFVARQWQKYQVGSIWREYELNTSSPNPIVNIDLIDLMYDTDKGCSWNEISGRYTQTSTDFYFPTQLRSNPPHGNKQSSEEYHNYLSSNDPDYRTEEELLARFKKSAQLALNEYYFMIKNGVAKELARISIPPNIYTESYWTVSLQAILHFLDQRLHKNAQFEIRKYAECIYSLVKEDLDKAGITIKQHEAL